MSNAIGTVPSSLLESTVLGLFNEPTDVNPAFIKLVGLAPVTPVKNFGKLYVAQTDQTWRGLDFQKTPKAASEISLTTGQLEPIEVSFGTVTGSFSRYPIGSVFISDDDRQMYDNSEIAIANYVGDLMVTRAYAILAWLVNTAITTTGNYTFAENPGALAASDSINEKIFIDLENELVLNQKWEPGLPINVVIAPDLVARFMSNNDYAKAIGVGSDYKQGMNDQTALGVWFSRYVDGCNLIKNSASYKAQADGAATSYMSAKLAFVRSDAKNAFCRFFVPTKGITGNPEQSAAANPGSMFRIWSARTDQDGVRGEIFYGDMYFALAVTNPGGGKLYHTFT